MPKNEEVEKELENEELEKTNSEEVSSSKKTTKEEKASTTKEKESKSKASSVTDEDIKKAKPNVDEETVIDKIKNFLAKIASMQEEARKEKEKEKEDKEKASKSKKNSKETVEEDVKEKPKYMLEYYDLPYRYNETVVKVLAQTPKKLFVYWDISDNDRDKYLKSFGEDFFYKTYPVLLVYNEDKKYVTEIPVNDFANSWYIDIQDPKTKYTIQLGRKFRGKPEIVNVAEFEQNHIILQTDYLPFADSNRMEAPNDHVLFETLPRFITFRNVKTNEEITRDLRSFKDAFGKNYKVKDFYENLYKDELSEDEFDMANPSSSNGRRVNSSVFK